MHEFEFIRAFLAAQFTPRGFRLATGSIFLAIGLIPTSAVLSSISPKKREEHKL